MGIHERTMRGMGIQVFCNDWPRNIKICLWHYPKQEKYNQETLDTHFVVQKSNVLNGEI